MNKLLIISENKDNLASMEVIVLNALPDICLLTALNSTQGMELARIEDPDVIFLDMAMSEMQSYEICRSLKADPGLKSIPVVFLTSVETAQASLAQAFDVGADSFLTLPMDVFNLKVQMRTMAKLKDANVVTWQIQASFNEEITRQIHEGIIVYGIDHRYLLWNPFMEWLSGIRAADVLGKQPSDVFPFLDKHDMYARIDQALSGTPTEPIEFHFAIPETGRTGWVQDSNSPLYNAKGEIIAVMATVRDITARKLAEEAAIAAKDFLKNIINNMGQPVFVKDDQHKMVLVNDAFCDIFGLHRSQIIGKTLAEDVAQDEQEHFIEIDNEVLSEGKKSVVEESLTIQENQPKTIVTTKTRYTNARGENFLIGIIQDMTERKEIEEALRRSSLLLEASQMTAKVGGWELDLKTNELFWTAETYRIHDTSPAEFNPTVDAGVGYFLPESRRIIYEALQAAMEQGEGYDLILETYTTKGRLINVRTTCVVTLDQGRPAKLTGIFQDITEQKQAEEAAIAAKDFLDNIINNMGQSVFVKDAQHRLLLVNDAFCDLFGLSRNQIIGKTLAENVPLDEREHFMKIDNEVLLEGKKSVDEESLTLQENQPKTILTAKTRYINKNGENFLIGVIQDITQRKETENELRRNKLLLENSQAIAKVGGWELDLTTNQLFWTAETYRIHDTSPEEFNPTVDAGVDCYSAESRPIIVAALQAAMEQGEGFDLILELFTTKGRRIDVRSTCVVTCEQGRPVRLTGSFRDITQMLQAEAEIRSKDIQFRKLSDNIPDLIFQFTRRSDGSYYVPIASKGIENIFGCTAEDVKEDFTAIAKAIHPEDIARVISVIESSAQHLTGFASEFRVQIPGREMQWILSRSKPEKLPDGSVTWFGFNVDITKQKQTEQKLEEYQQKLEQLVNVKTDELHISERRFRHLVEGVKQDYFFFTIGSEGIFTYLSPSAEAFFGQSMGNLLGRSGNELLDLGKESPLYPGELSTEDQDPPPFEIELTLQGEKRYLEISEHITKNKIGLVIAEEGVIKNITRQKRIEQELREAIESAKIASQAKSMFLANMSHEIRTPMNAILGFSELMQEQSTEPRFKKYLEVINSSGKALLKIINEILDLSKIESGKLTLNPEPANPIQIIEELKVLLEGSFLQKGLHFYVETSAEMPKYLELDALRLRQVLLNLLGNALKFTSVGEVSLKIDFVPQNADCGCLTLTVQDTGIGISVENQKRIFTAFEQVSDSQHSFSGGTGLGLTISQSLVSLMGGELHMSSIVGQGTCFTIVLPEVHLAESVEAEPIQAPLDMNLFLPAQLLIADDVPENLFLLESMFESSPFDVILAHNGREACEMAQTIHPNVILMDIKMPVMDGIQAMQQLKSQTETQAIPVIALTAYSLKQDQESLLQKGFDAYLSKPVQKSDLLRCLKDFLPIREMNAETAPVLAEPVLTTVQLSSAELKHLRQMLMEHLLPRWHTVRDSVVIDELDSFANELLELAKQYQLISVQNFALGLLSQINQFALEQAQQDLSGFPHLVESILQESSKA